MAGGGFPSPTQDFERKWFGRNVRYQVSKPVAGTSVTTILAKNPNRMGLIIVNRSASEVDFAFDSVLAVGGGIPLGPGGGSVTMQIDEDGDMVIGDIFGIAPIANSQLYVVEALADAS